MLYCCFLLLGCSNFAVIQGHLTVDQIRELWTKHVEISENFERPTCYGEYQCDTEDCKDYGEYDFVIVGGADSAPVLANRLAKLNKWRILLLLMGEKGDAFASMPATEVLLKNSAANLAYLTTPQEYACLATNGHRCVLDIFKSESPKNVFYVRPRKEDFERWVDAGNTMWSYEENLPYFKKSEDMLVKKILKGNDYHGTKGPMPVVHSETPRLFNNIIEAYKEMSFPVLLDYNGDEFEGISKLQVHVRNGSKITPIKAYLDPIVGSKLRVLYGAYAFQIVFNAHKRAVSLKFSYKNTCHAVGISKELILAAGAVITPQLLLLSGIGPKDDLMKHGIPVIADLPVGKNLIDDPVMVVEVLHSQCEPPSDLYSEFVKYTHGSGMLSAPRERLIAFHNIPNQLAGNSRAMITYLTKEMVYNSRVFQKTWNYGEDTGLWYSGDNPNDLIIFIKLLHQNHRGYLTLHSADPFQYPKIDPGYLTDPHDLNNAYIAYELVLKLLNTTAMQRIQARTSLYHLDYCEKACTSRFRINCLISHIARASADPLGTAKMGCDATAVVNQNLVVHGLHGVRIVDGSVIPDGISGLVSTTEVMMAEKIADVIIKLHKH